MQILLRTLASKFPTDSVFVEKSDNWIQVEDDVPIVNPVIESTEFAYKVRKCSRLFICVIG
jgi:hypothetical protein